MALGQKLLFQDSKTETYKEGKANIIWMNHGHQQKQTGKGMKTDIPNRGQFIP